jgi:hypothetical protein
LSDDQAPSPHVIRLRTAWINVPLSTESTARVCCQRRFGRPTGLDPATRVRLVVNDCRSGVRILLNGEPLEATESHQPRLEFDITDKLRPRNTLQIETVGAPDITLDSSSSFPVDDRGRLHSCLGKVQLEIWPQCCVKIQYSDQVSTE